MNLSLAQAPRFRQISFVENTNENDAERLRWGRALALLRAESGLTQGEAAERLGVSSQAWGQYETGKVAGIFKPDTQRKLAAALDFAVVDLERAREAVDRQGGYVTRRQRGNVVQLPVQPREQASLELKVFSRALAGMASPAAEQSNDPDRTIDLGRRFSGSVRGTQLVGDSLYPWGSSGIVAVYDTNLFPRREQGCVVFFKNGSAPLVKLFESLDSENLTVTELQPELRKLVFPLADVAGVYAVIDRMEP
jgi:transcriptional regulator with XRE-family HTH domain